MATVNFLYRSTKDKSILNVRLLFRDKDNKDLVLGAKTKLLVTKSQWEKIKIKPKDKQLKIERDKLLDEVSKIENYIINEFYSTPEQLVNKEWLIDSIENYYYPKEKSKEDKQSDIVVDAIDYLIDNSGTRINSKKEIGISKSRINTYKGLRRLFVEFQGKQSYKVKDINIKLANNFLKWLTETKKYKNSYATKKIADLKTVCLDAEINDVEVNKQLKHIKSTKSSNGNIIYLSEEELIKIENTELKTDALKNARKFLLLGCNIGQRGGDLLNINSSNFKTIKGLKIIELKQQKTGKNVTIPVLETTEKILKDGLPYKISIQKFNNYIKEICKLTGLTEATKGSKILMVDKDGNIITKDEKGNYTSKGFKRSIEGYYPKHELISSHVCRRSFATNYYIALPTPLVMSITGHSTEKMLLNYIGKDSLDYAQIIADFYSKKNTQPQL